jgi:hypothetical protein
MRPQLTIANTPECNLLPFTRKIGEMLLFVFQRCFSGLMPEEWRFCIFEPKNGGFYG